MGHEKVAIIVSSHIRHSNGASVQYWTPAGSGCEYRELRNLHNLLRTSTYRFIDVPGSSDTTTSG